MRDGNNPASEMKALVLEFCERQRLLPGEGRVLCAVSGGADSMSMLHLFSNMPSSRLTVVCAHFNHKLRGEESDRDERFVRRYCEKNEIPFVRASRDVKGWAEENGTGLEEAARVLRYEFLEEAARECGSCRILTAHTADDNLETMLFNLVRGAGLRGLCGIPPRRGSIIRPLLSVTRKRIEDYLSAVNIDYVTDSTNDTEIYSRNRLRKTVVPLLREINGQAAENALAAALLMRRDEEYLEGLARDFIEKNAYADALPAKELLLLPKPVSSRVMRMMSGSGIDRRHVDALMELCEGESPSARIGIPGLEVRREYDRIVFSAAREKNIEPRPISPGDFFELFPEGPWIKCEYIKKCPDINTSFNIFYFHNESIYGRIHVRSFMPGDKVRFYGRNCTKKLKKLFSDEKIPRHDRGGVPVLTDNMGIIAVGGFGVAERCAPKPGHSALKIEIWEKT